jgi:hypothetical protein
MVVQVYGSNSNRPFVEDDPPAQRCLRPLLDHQAAAERGLAELHRSPA